MVIKIVTLSCLLLSVGVFSKDVRIIGGENSSINEFPYLVSLKLVDTNSHICAGTIISDKHVLTAAHCIFQKHIYCSLLRIHTGSSTLSSTNGSIFLIDRIYIHPEYVGKISGKNYFHNDISIIKIQGNIPFNEFQNKIDLTTENVIGGNDAVISGWGILCCKSYFFSNIVQRAVVKIVDYAECLKKVSFPLLRDQICTYKKGVTARMGDSGGPVISNNKIIGIISFSVVNVPDVPDIHTNVYMHLDFIRSVISY